MNTFRRRAASSVIALTVVAGATALTAPVAFATEATAEPTPVASETTTATATETATPAETATETPAESAPAAEPQLATSESTYAPSATLEGVPFVATNLPQEGEVVVELTLPDGKVLEVDPMSGTPYAVDAEGTLADVIELTQDGVTVEFPEGDYTLTITVGEVVVSTTFTVAAETATETPAVEPSLWTEKSAYTLAETVDGINWAAEGLVPGEAYTVELVYPDGTVVVVPPVGDKQQVADADGTAAGNIQYSIGDEPAPFEAEGTYTIRVIQGALVLETTTVVGTASEEPTSTPTATTTGSSTAGSSTSGSSSNGSGLAETGATAETAGIALGAGLVLVAAGAGMVLVRRRMA